MPLHGVNEQQALVPPMLVDSSALRKVGHAFLASLQRSRRGRSPCREFDSTCGWFLLLLAFWTKAPV